jgi:PAT family beta-lactamase induction signal transducer AmpG
MNDKNILILLFGFISGFTIPITGNSLNFWLAKSNISPELIGILSIASIPYAFNFLWSPLVDQYKIPYLEKKYGHRYSWIIILNLLMALSILFLSFCNPSDNIKILCIVTLIISFFSSTKDAVLNAWRSEITEGVSQGSFMGWYIFSYRLGLLVSSSVTIYISTFISWNNIYRIYALIVLLFPISLYSISKNYIKQDKEYFSKIDKFTFIIFIKNIVIKYGGVIPLIIILFFLVLYRIPDNFLNSMINIFFLDKHYNEYEIASIGKFLGIVGSIIGGFVASYLLDRISIIKSLYLFGIIHSISFLLFLNLVFFEHNLIIYALVIGFQSITGGMAMAAYIAYITSLCSGKYRATQYSFLSSMMGLSRSLFPTMSGYIVSYYGWTSFYILIFIISIPSILMTKYLFNGQIKND